jgi:hypothetical protein
MLVQAPRSVKRDLRSIDQKLDWISMEVEVSQGNLASISLGEQYFGFLRI